MVWFFLFSDNLCVGKLKGNSHQILLPEMGLPGIEVPIE